MWSKVVKPIKVCKEQVANKFFIPCFKRFKGSLANVRLAIKYQVLVRMLTATMGRILILGLRPSAESSVEFIGWFGLFFFCKKRSFLCFDMYFEMSLPGRIQKIFV